MSYFRNRAFVALLTMCVLVFGPYTALAQNWQPPTGAPPGNNTPAPVNVGNATQTKSGGLTVGGTLTGSSSIISDIASTLKGQSIFTNTATGSGNNFLVSFIKNYFYSDTQFGQPTPIGYPDPVNPTPVNVGVFGRLNYQTADDNGNPIPVQAGSVLSSDASGNASWVDPSTLGGGGSGSNHLIIKKDGATVLSPITESLNFVETGDYNLLNVVQTSPTTADIVINSAALDAITPGGTSLPNGTADGQVLRWNQSTGTWQPTSKVIIGSSTTTIDNTTLAVGTPNTNTLFLTTGTNPGSKVIINSPMIRIPLGNTAAANRVLVSTDAQGTVAWANPASIGIGGGGGGNLPPGEIGDTLWFDGSSWLNTNKLQWNTTGNNLMFNGDNLMLPGNNQSLNPAAGRFLYSTDNQGKVRWNPTLTYEDIASNGLTLNTVHIIDPDSDNTTFPAFINDGFTVLNGATLANSKVMIDANLQIMNQGDIYLDHLDTPTNAEATLLLPVCYNNTTHRLTKCSTITALPGGQQVNGDNGTYDTTLTFHPIDNGHSYTFDFDGNVGLKWCGGGGGGGGGGIGGYGPNGTVGGGGGGGGQKGFCQTMNSVHVHPGDVLTWNIGNGGNGGSYAAFDDYNGVSSMHGASNGLQGQSTSVYLNGPQVGSTQIGGFGGLRGESVPSLAGNPTCHAGNGDVYACGGPNGNNSLAGGSSAEQAFYNGDGGHFNGTGGSGGAGDNDNGMSITPGSPSSGGGAGALGDYSTGIVHGAGGRAGVDANGGGGGGGSASVPQVFIYSTGGIFGNDFSGIEHMLNGGDGGRGGDGYLTITGLPTPDQPVSTEIVYDTPGTFTFSPASLPMDAQHINIEVWGAGGGGGGVSAANQVGVCAGGGGSGSYGRLENFPRPTGAVSITVGAGGAAGLITNNGATGGGGNGGMSKFGTVITAPGGSGGHYDDNSNGCSLGGSGGNPATGATQNTPGNDGEDGSATGGHGGAAVQGFGGGGNGGTYNGSLANPTGGNAGRVRITWN